MKGCIKIGFYLFLMTVAGCFVYQKIHFYNPREVYILPDKFIGRIFISWDDAGGYPVEYQGRWPQRWRVYRIPPSGIFRTQFHRKNGAVDSTNQRAYYQQTDGSLKKIKFCSHRSCCGLNFCLSNRNEVFIGLGDGGSLTLSDSIVYLRRKSAHPSNWDTIMPQIELSFNTMRVGTVNSDFGEKNLIINSYQYHNWKTIKY